MTGKKLPHIQTKIPGPRSRRLGRELLKYEAPGITCFYPHGPIFWHSARGANVEDVDGNRYIDTSAGFGVANTGFQNPAIIRAAIRQSQKLLHVMGDVYPGEEKVQLLKALAKICPAPLTQGIFGNTGSEAVEIALKTAMLFTKKPDIIAFEGAYHGLSYGALGVTGHEIFRKPFRNQLPGNTFHLPFPEHYPLKVSVEHCLERVQETLQIAQGSVGAIMIEPIQGRGGIHRAPASFLQGLRRICDEEKIVLIFDEIFTGFGRTGKWFAFQHSRVSPDLLCIGKAMSGGFPISVCMGKTSIMKSWETGHGEALHTSTSQGNPVGCSMALASIRTIQQQKLAQKASRLGSIGLSYLKQFQKRSPHVGDLRGLGLFLGIELVRNKSTGEPAPEKALKVMTQALQQGIIVLIDGENHNVIALTPPLTITKKQWLHALDIIMSCINNLKEP
ncbi:MAG: aspartate aminotransferase family protein [Chlamydiota bacterium]|nr:aspartate aminotransferase family protein [Chlamydiota bacterium]